MRQRRRTRRVLATLCAAMGLFTLNCCWPEEAPAAPVAPTKTKSYPGWILNQTSQLLGMQVLTVSAIGIKTSNRKSSVSLVMTPPFKTVTIYNDQNKTIFQTPVKLFRSPYAKGMAIFGSNMLGDAPMVPAGKVTLNGFNVSKYKSTEAYNLQQVKLKKAGQIPASTPQMMESQSSDDLHLAPGAALALCRLYGIPLVPGIPVEARNTDLEHHSSYQLQTTKCTKTMVSEKDFALPRGYEHLKNLQEMTKSDVTEDGMLLFGR